MDKLLKILISAYECSLVLGSKHGIGWGFSFALAQFHDLWVMTEKIQSEEKVSYSRKFMACVLLLVL
ncbi:MAG: hypothetical protein AVO38_08080 [delta proteobacterium ML8_D]|nr:MAG: hypothetical protein AVO38_08080 [delta proteobacterium ML8_D]